MKCPKCGAEVKEGLAACSVCFAPLTGEEAERVAKLAKEAPQITPRTQRKAESAPRSSGGGKAVAVILFIILLAAAGAGGWYYFIYMRSPQYAARQFLEALKTKNYEQIYQTCRWTGLLANVRSGQDVRRAFETAQRLGLDVSIESYEVEGAEVQENRATVKTVVVRNGKRDGWNVVMVKNKDGQWKCDLLSSLMSAIGGSLRLPGMQGLPLGR